MPGTLAPLQLVDDVRVQQNFDAVYKAWPNEPTYAGTGSPEGVVTGGPGALYIDYATGQVYVHRAGTVGTTGWEPLTTTVAGYYGPNGSGNGRTATTPTGWTAISAMPSSYLTLGTVAIAGDTFTVQKAGLYLIHAHLRIDLATDGHFAETTMTVAGTVRTKDRQMAAGAGALTSHNMTLLRRLAVNDTIQTVFSGTNVPGAGAVVYEVVADAGWTQFEIMYLGA